MGGRVKVESTFFNGRGYKSHPCSVCINETLLRIPIIITIWSAKVHDPEDSLPYGNKMALSVIYAIIRHLHLNGKSFFASCGQYADAPIW